MHNKQIENDLIIEYNLNTYRTKRQKIRKARYRQIRNLFKELLDTYSAIRGLGYEPLDPPIQRGWLRTFVLREDVAKSPKANFYQGILDRINTERFSKRKDFKVKKHRKGKYRYVQKEQKLKTLDLSDFNKMNEKEKEGFRHLPYYCKYRKEIRHKYEYIDTWRFVLKTMPNMVTRIKVIDPALEAKADELSYYLYDCKQAYMLDSLSGNYSKWYDTGYQRHKTPLRNKTKTAIMEEYYSEKQFEATL